MTKATVSALSTSASTQHNAVSKQPSLTAKEQVKKSPTSTCSITTTTSHSQMSTTHASRPHIPTVKDSSEKCTTTNLPEKCTTVNLPKKDTTVNSEKWEPQSLPTNTASVCPPQTPSTNDGLQSKIGNHHNETAKDTNKMDPTVKESAAIPKTENAKAMEKLADNQTASSIKAESQEESAKDHKGQLEMTSSEKEGSGSEKIEQGAASSRYVEKIECFLCYL